MESGWSIDSLNNICHYLILIYIDEALGILFIGMLYTKYYKNKYIKYIKNYISSITKLKYIYLNFLRSLKI